MGYSARYHAASLAAVFLALAIGILIGVGFGSDLVTGTAEDLERSLASDLDAAREQVNELEAALEAQEAFAGQLVPAVVADRLRGREVALVAFGELDEALAADVRSALNDSGATLSEIAIVREPPNVGEAADAVSDGRRVPRGTALNRAARRTGRALTRGGPDFDRLRQALFSRYSGQPGDIDAVVVTRQRPNGLSTREQEDSERIEERMIDGMRSGREPGSMPIVGVETTATDPSSVEFFGGRDLTTVDNVDQLAGRVSLVFALGGAEGRFGVKDTADRLLPDLLTPPSLNFGAGRAGS